VTSAERLPSVAYEGTDAPPWGEGDALPPPPTAPRAVQAEMSREARRRPSQGRGHFTAAIQEVARAEMADRRRLAVLRAGLRAEAERQPMEPSRVAEPEAWVTPTTVRGRPSRR